MARLTEIAAATVTAAPPDTRSRFAVVDLGSNSIRLVIFEGLLRNPRTIFNEKAVIGLGRGLVGTGRLNGESVERAITILRRYKAVADGMGARVFQILATAAVRDALNGRDFVAAVEQAIPGVAMQVLSGEEEGRMSAQGLMLGFTSADGVLADLGGGSLELVGLRAGAIGDAASLPLGTIRLNERAEDDVGRARGIVEGELDRLPWLRQAEGRDLFLVGGTFRALARMHMAQTRYPLNIVHHYAIRREEARDLAGVVMSAPRRSLERMPAAPAKRLNDLPFAAVILRRLLRATGAARVIFSANGLREGWYGRLLPDSEKSCDPLLSAAEELSRSWVRDEEFPAALDAWLAPLRLAESRLDQTLLAASVQLSDIGHRDHPDYRAEQSFLRVLRQSGVGLDHFSRAFLALTVALRYEAEPNSACLPQASALLDAASVGRAELWGAAFRLAFTLSGGVAALLADTSITRGAHAITLHLRPGRGVFAGEAVSRRLDALAGALGLTGQIVEG